MASETTPYQSTQTRQLGVSDADAIIERDIRSQWPRLWLAMYIHRNARGEMLDFTKRTWQIALYQDPAVDIVFQKASRIGVTEFFIVDHFLQLSRGLNCMYLLPNQPLRNRFVSARIDPVILKTPFYSANVKQTDKAVHSKSLKTVFGSTCAYIGSNSPVDVWEFDADGMFYDEYDKCDAVTLEYAKDRTGASKDPHTRKIGNPTVATRGIAKEYENSDKKVWHIRCSHCNTWQPLDWFANVVEQVGEREFRQRGLIAVDSNGIEDLSFLCYVCSKPVDRLARGEWVSSYPSRSVSGYQANQIFGRPLPQPVISQLWEHFMFAQSNPTSLERFYNNVLGIPYQSEGAGITETMLARCVADYLMPSTGAATFAGVDVGSNLHTSICELVKLPDGRTGRKKLWLGKLKDFDELHWLCKTYGVQRGVIDAMPETRLSREFCRNHPGWFMCYYDKADTSKSFYDIKRDTRTISTNRTQILDASFSEYVDGLVQLPNDWRHLCNGEFVAQMCAPVRIYDVDKERYDWVEGSAADHFRHADTYELLACMVSGYGRVIGAGTWI